MRKTIFVVLVGAMMGFVTNPLPAQSRLEKNVIYGMYSGLALLMDVYHPPASNGHAILFVAGSAFGAPLELSAAPLKDGLIVQDFAKKLTGAGYTVFAVNHRASPRFQYPAAVDDVQRAVRFIRANASNYTIDPNRIGASGASSGGHLVSMLGVLDGQGDPDDLDPVNRLSSKVQTVVAMYAPYDLTLQLTNSDAGGIPEALFVGARIGPNTPSAAVEYKRYAIASPINYVTEDDAPFLLFHGDADTTVPIEQSRRMDAALRKAGVQVQLVPVPGGRHGRNFAFSTDDPRLPDYLGRAAEWFDKHLRRKSN